MQRADAILGVQRNRFKTAHEIHVSRLYQQPAVVVWRGGDKWQGVVAAMSRRRWSTAKLLGPMWVIWASWWKAEFSQPAAAHFGTPSSSSNICMRQKCGVSDSEVRATQLPGRLTWRLLGEPLFPSAFYFLCKWLSSQCLMDTGSMYLAWTICISQNCLLRFWWISTISQKTSAVTHENMLLAYGIGCGVSRPRPVL